MVCLRFLRPGARGGGGGSSSPSSVPAELEGGVSSAAEVESCSERARGSVDVLSSLLTRASNVWSKKEQSKLLVMGFLSSFAYSLMNRARETSRRLSTQDRCSIDW